MVIHRLIHHGAMYKNRRGLLAASLSLMLACSNSATGNSPCDPNPCPAGFECTERPETTIGFECEACPPGSGGDSCTNSCEDLDCYPGVPCIELPSPGMGFSCGDCPDGLRGDGRVCASFDETTLVAVEPVLPVADGPIALASGDFNEDGAVDLAVANHDSPSRIHVFDGNGSGSFATGVPVFTGGVLESLRAIDLNQDGHQDLIATDTLDGGEVHLLSGSGGGSFSAVSLLVNAPDIMGNPVDSGIGDFDEDGTLDVVIVSSNQNSARVFLSDGDGGYSARSHFASGGAGPQAIEIADFDEDGHLDMLVSHFGTRNITIQAGDGMGGFSPHSSFQALSSRNRHTALGDFNEDGLDDVAVSSSQRSSVAILLGDGSGNLAQASLVPVGGIENSAIIAVDMDRDDHTDLIVLNFAAGLLRVLLGDGTGGFPTSVEYSLGAGSLSDVYDVIAADFNGDDWPDLAVSDRASNQVLVLLHR